MYLLLHEVISFHDSFFVCMASLREYISEAFPGSQTMHSKQNSMVSADMTQPVRLNPDNYNLFSFLCVLCASARVNICSFFYIANSDCTDKSLRLTLRGRTSCVQNRSRRFCRTSSEYRTHNNTNNKAPHQGLFVCMAGELGFEPRLTESESVVLPLDDSPGKQVLGASY